MVNRNKLTSRQIASMIEYIKKFSSTNKGMKNKLRMYYHIDTPKDVYVQYTSYGLEDDNSIYSQQVIQCIKPDGSSEDCATKFDNLKQKMEFNSGLLEIDLDANGNVIFL